MKPQIMQMSESDLILRMMELRKTLTSAGLMLCMQFVCLDRFTYHARGHMGVLTPACIVNGQAVHAFLSVHLQELTCLHSSGGNQGT